ncbi:hypothetical protein BV908_09065 [Diaphorobacter sp. LR2014-1]|nr:hypothetical protein BV908_09065 [Diaphorobacter sp. LR2014-1]
MFPKSWLRPTSNEGASNFGMKHLQHLFPCQPQVVPYQSRFRGQVTVPLQKMALILNWSGAKLLQSVMRGLLSPRLSYLTARQHLLAVPQKVRPIRLML